jgi:hypothetical protein
MIGTAKTFGPTPPPPPPTSQYMDAIGGQIYLSGSYKYHYFTASGTFQVTQVGYDPTEGNVIEFLLVGGGGGGGRGARIDTGGGGGGAGEFVTGSYNVSVGTYSCNIGAGGLGAPTYSLYSGSQGTSSFFTPITGLGYSLVAIGGGYGTGFRYYAGTFPNYLSSSFGGNGGSGGGSTYTSNLDSTVYGGLGVYPTSGSSYFWRGNNSGQGRSTGQVPGRPGIDNPINYGGGAGGGATQVGGGPFNYYKYFGEQYNGGAGNFWKYDYFSGSYYAGGGAAGVDGTPTSSVIIAGGIGGGGTAGRGGISNAGSGTPNTGGGGGGAGYWDSVTNAGNGGSGIVAVRYRYQ